MLINISSRKFMSFSSILQSFLIFLIYEKGFTEKKGGNVIKICENQFQRFRDANGVNKEMDIQILLC